MLARLDAAAMAVLRRLDPEVAHDAALAALRLGLARFSYQRGADDPALAVAALGLHFANPIGLAAGFDKDAVATPALMRLGFGFVEIGSVTPCPQLGNPRPRLFRLDEDRGVINRMGMNSQGVGRVAKRLARLRGRPRPLGASISINKGTSRPERDYPVLMARLAPFVDYLAINVSSPNTPGLRDLQAATRLAKILRALAAWAPERLPLLVKIAPDLGEDELSAIVETALESGVSGLIVTNTTTARPSSLRSAAARESGGLSGAPLFPRSTALLARVYQRTRGRVTLIGCGGVSTGREALMKIKAGASLVQVFSAFAYAGPRMLPRIKAELLEALKVDGFASVTAAIGVEGERIATDNVTEAV